MLIQECGVAINKADIIHNETPLHYAVWRIEYMYFEVRKDDQRIVDEMVRLLVGMGADCGLKNRSGQTLLDIAVQIQRSGECCDALKL
ncbi:hypothetical protein BC936DRAFT_148609 [Jimgerdemannia flammicorona]|uniref:Uncharacterized protein n=1 Tax=Jimgerdemannia flammicorona TaxID=994334 RepID=A0A433D2P4_9FUNG|nr:hypothetical protein BC936DRAFT_148609 [Jimgerdemannia flammicorona]